MAITNLGQALKFRVIALGEKQVFFVLIRAPDKLRIAFICNIDLDWMIYRKHPIRSLLTSMLRKASIWYPSEVYALSFKKYKGK
jgi:hypothetical protein